MSFQFLLVCMAMCSMALSGPVYGQSPLPPTDIAKETPGYLVVTGKTTDRAKIGTYAAALPPIYASHGAYYLAIGAGGRGVNWIEGPWKDRSVILAKFPTRREVDAFWWGEPYRLAIRKRDNAGVFSVVALQGTVSLPYEGDGVGFLIVMTSPRDNTRQQMSLSTRANEALGQGVMASGGTLLASSEPGQFTAMEGDAVFDRFTLAVWPTTAARDAFVSGGSWQRGLRLRKKLGLSAVATANGVSRAQAPPAANSQ
jgi:uncharacterized protein (DUF1330 family)